MVTVAGRTFRSFRSRNFRLYFGGIFVSNIGTWLQATVLSWLVLQQTRSGIALGLLGVFQWGPMLLLGAWAGALSDRVDKRRMVLCTQAAAAVQALALGVVVLAGFASFPLILGLAAALGLINAVDNPARRGFIPQLVSPGDIGNAMALNTSVMTSSRILGPALGGLLLSRIGPGWCFLLNAASYAATIGGIVALRRDELRMVPLVERSKGQVSEGIRYAWGHPVLRVALVATAVLGVLAFNYQTTFPLLAERALDGDAASFGVLLSVTSVGSLAGSLVVASRAEPTPGLLQAAAGGFGAAMLALSAAPNLPIALALSLPLGAAGSAFVSTVTGLLQRHGRPDMRGRLMSLQAVLFLGSTPIGALVVGTVAEVVNARAALVVGGVAGVATALAAPTIARAGVAGRPASTTLSDSPNT
jgi:MFS family permease